MNQFKLIKSLINTYEGGILESLKESKPLTEMETIEENEKVVYRISIIDTERDRMHTGSSIKMP
jgi:hypothetical protein